MSNSANDNVTIPTLGLQGFRENQVAGKEDILFNQLSGEKIINRPHKHDFFMIILFKKGCGVHTIDSVDYSVGDREVHVLFPNQMHQWHLKDGTVGYQLMIEKSFLEQFAPAFRFSFTNYQNHPVIALSKQSFDLLLYEFNAIRGELSESTPITQIISARSAVIAALVSKVAENDMQEVKVFQSNPRLAKFNWLIDKFYKEEKSIAFYAEQLHVSPNYLNILCKKNLKITASHLIQQRVVTEAKRLLLSSDRSIKEISYDLGFSDHAYFSNFFKAQTNMTPSQLRGQL